MNDFHFFQWCRDLNLSKTTQSLIQQIRVSPPSRRVGGGRSNVCGSYPSKKMGVTIQFESHTVELPAIYQLEHDNENVIEYYDQPSQIKLNYAINNGRNVGVLYTPDFFVIRKDSAGWEEWKDERELTELAKRCPTRYIKGEDGKWHCPPGEQYADKHGLYFHVHSSSEINWVFQRNINYLEDYLRADNLLVSDEAKNIVLNHVAQEPGIALNRLLQCSEGVTADDINTLIATGQLYINLYAAPLAEPGLVQVYLDSEIAKAHSVIMSKPPKAPSYSGVINIIAGSRISWDEVIWTIINVGLEKVTLMESKENGSLIELPKEKLESMIGQGIIKGLPGNVKNDRAQEIEDIYSNASPEDLNFANVRYKIIYPRIEDNYSPGIVEEAPARTIREWLRRYREAEELYGCGYIGLLPRKRTGNCSRKLPEKSLVLLRDFIENSYETLRQKPRLEVYGAYVIKCEEEGTDPASYKTFCKEVNSRPKHQQILKRKGRRAAYASEPFYWELEQTTPRHGDRPFQIAHIDHTETDLEHKCSTTNRNLGRSWMTLLTDAFSRRILATVVSFDPPSYRSCMSVLRECVKRHSRLPETIVVDGGREFDSIYFETLLARYEITKKKRPAAKPRYGSVCERLFGTTNTRFVHNLIGNTQITRNVRQVTKSVNPKNLAIWPLPRFYERLCEYLYEVYDSIEHPALGQSPGDAFISGIQQAGTRPYRLIPYDENFRMHTFPTTRKGTAMVEPGQGVKINYIYYWSPTFIDPTIEKRQVPVRYDPFDAGIAYAYVSGRWVHCTSQYHGTLNERTEKEIRMATEEIRKRLKNHGKQIKITAKAIASYLNSVEAEEMLLLQRLKDKETKTVLRVIEGGKTISPEYEFLIEDQKPKLLNLAPTFYQEGEEVYELYEEF